MSDEYLRLSQRWNELDAKEDLDDAELIEARKLHAKMTMWELNAAARSDTQAIAALGGIHTEYEAQREYGDYGGVEWV